MKTTRSISWRFILAVLPALTILGPDLFQRAVAQESPPAIPSDLRFPKFESNAPEFCRLSLPGAGTAKIVLLILDRSNLYVDRNANGDLTEADERVPSEKSSRFSERDLHFKIGAIKLGKLEHLDVNLIVMPLENFDRNTPSISEQLKANPTADTYKLWAEIQREPPLTVGGGRSIMLVGGFDTDGVLQFGSSPESAPTIDFAGPLEVRLMDDFRLRPGSDAEVIVAVGSKGNGPGTFAALAYENVIPDDVWPTLSLTTDSGNGESVTTSFDLQHRC